MEFRINSVFMVLLIVLVAIIKYASYLMKVGGIIIILVVAILLSERVYIFLGAASEETALSLLKLRN